MPHLENSSSNNDDELIFLEYSNGVLYGVGKN